MPGNTPASLRPPAHQQQPTPADWVAGSGIPPATDDSTSTMSGTTTGHVVACLECRLPAGAYPTRGEAELLANVHDRLHHGGNPTAQITAGGICESCQTRPATTTWHHPNAGAPFALCPICAPEPVGRPVAASTGFGGA
jgi:hypothetical protein